MAGNVTEAQSHDEGSDGRSITGVHWNVMGKEQNCNLGNGNAMSRHRSVTGGMASWFTTLYSWA